MIKVAIFTEGQSELIFVRYLLFRLVDNSKLKLECIELRGSGQRSIPFSHSGHDPAVDFLIVNVGNDERVLSAIRERERGLFKVGYQRVIGLRDMYSQAYHNRSQGVIDDEVAKEFIAGAQETIKTMSKPQRVTLYFAIMELEAWFLSMYNLFKKVSDALSVRYIEEELGFNLQEIDPETAFYKPSRELNSILSLTGRGYQKSRHEVEGICSRIEIDDCDDAMENGRCKAFGDFYSELSRYQC